MQQMTAITTLLLAALTITQPLAPARAQIEPPSSSFLTPFPENDLYRLLVVGDTLAEGLLPGLIDAMGSEPRVQIQRKHRPSVGLARQEADDELRALDEAMAKDNSHIIVVMLGANDRIPIRASNGRRIMVGSDDWRTEYGRRVDRMMKSLKRKSTAIYWVGLPIMRRQEWNDDVEIINEVMRERAVQNGLRYIDAFSIMTDDRRIQRIWS